MTTEDVPEDFAIWAFMLDTNHQFLKHNLFNKPPVKLSSLYKMAYRFTESDEIQRVNTLFNETLNES
ncbi:hypothetical protein J1N35_033266 [Gossypium stocksii]|uniref:Uncharacterized protein n=1 Tax=Gossypium stocksii TaxID=47602 RepID=A0A9D3UPN8_9ROSI|nr:hypothetical protein J1N35_033266 [Gossypium stocksii]